MSEAKVLDQVDKNILRIVQKDASLSIGDIAAKVGLSQTPCWKRLQKLEANGIIRRRIAVLDPIKLGLGMTVFVSIKIGDHTAAALARFADDIALMDEVMDLYRVAGDIDYILRVVVSDAAAFDEFYKRLIALFPLKSVTSHFALENIKAETAFPITA
jgi:Lrp/AsnC family transcriptional regulator